MKSILLVRISSFLSVAMAIFGLSLSASSLCSAQLPATPRVGGPQLSAASQARATTQIAAVMREKAGRSPAQRKMDSQLIYAVREAKDGLANVDAPKMHSSVKVRGDNTVELDIKALISDALLADVKARGGSVEATYPSLGELEYYYH